MVLLSLKITLILLCGEFGVEFEVFEEVAFGGVTSDFSVELDFVSHV